MNATEQAIELRRLKDVTMRLERIETQVATLQEQVRQLQPHQAVAPKVSG